MKKIFFIFFLLPMFVHAQTISITTASDSICPGAVVNFTAITTGTTVSPHFVWKVNNVTAGIDSFGFHSNSLKKGDSVFCILILRSSDTLAISNTLTIKTKALPDAGIIAGNDSVCIGTSIPLSTSLTGGTWSATNNYATVVNGIVTGAGTKAPHDFLVPQTIDTIIYSITNVCGVATSTFTVTVVPAPDAKFTIDHSPHRNWICIDQRVSVQAYGGLLYGSNNVTIDRASITGVYPGDEDLYNVFTNACGADTFGMTISIVDKPSVSQIISPADKICPGSEITLSSIINGQPKWFIDKNIAEIDATTGLLKGLASGVVTVYLSAGNECGQTPAISKTITILPPDAISSADSCCAGGKITMSDNTPGGIWSVSNPAIATIGQAGTLLALQTGVVQINYTIDQCTTAKNVKVLPELSLISSPPILGPYSICTNYPTTFSHNYSGGTWSNTYPSITDVNVSTGSVTGKKEGLDTINYDLPNGCRTHTEVVVRESPPPIVGVTYLCQHAETILSDAVVYGRWSADTTMIFLEEKTGLVRGTVIGDVAITYTVKNMCFTTTTIKVTNCEAKVTVFPNPAHDQLILHSDNHVFHVCSILNSMGQLALQIPVNDDFTKLDLRGLINGNYILVLSGYDEDNKIIKFLKE